MRRGSSAATPTTPTSASARARSRYLVVVVLGFVLATASFVGASLFADSRLERVAKLTEAVSDNAMPSLAQIGTMQGELAEIHLALDQAARGEGGDLSALNEHVQELEAARRQYEALPQFPDEPAVWARARPMLDEVPRVSAEVMSDVRAGDLPRARARVAEDLAPADAIVDAALAELRRINLEAGTRVASRASRAWARTRVVSLVLDLACAVFTAGLAWLAFRSARRYGLAEARRADELDAFAARVAHDLRGPLTPALFALQRMARDLDASSPQRAIVERGARGLQRADVLIRDLLTFARASAAPEAETHASLPPVVAGVVDDLEREASAAHVHLDVADLPPCEISCGPGVLSSIVGNLVGNAIKYMPPEAKDRRVHVRAIEAHRRVRVEVSDTGAGLSADAQARIFEPYVRADRSRPGLGLGLATVKRLVQAHRGRVGVQSRVGSGSTFWFELPASREEPSKPVPSRGVH